jgi:hypothetical protein
MLDVPAAHSRTIRNALAAGGVPVADWDGRQYAITVNGLTVAAFVHRDTAEHERARMVAAEESGAFRCLPSCAKCGTRALPLVRRGRYLRCLAQHR